MLVALGRVALGTGGKRQKRAGSVLLVDPEVSTSPCNGKDSGSAVSWPFSLRIQLCGAV